MSTWLGRDAEGRVVDVASSATIGPEIIPAILPDLIPAIIPAIVPEILPLIPAGPQGDTGVAGPPGQAGPAGNQGPAGQPGVAGTTGATGPAGPPGATGNTGAQGATGSQGLPGADGAQGIQGPPGTNGAAGAQGIQGIPGNTGSQGIQGIPGPGAPIHAVLANGTLAMGFGTPRTSVKVTPTATGTFTTTVPVAGTRCVIIILTAGTTSFMITFGSGFKPVGTLATGTVTARVFVLDFISDGTNLYEAGRTAAMVA